MEIQASQLIDAYGGTTVVANAMKAPVSTVHSWRRIGIPDARREHFDLLVETGRLVPTVPSQAEAA